MVLGFWFSAVGWVVLVGSMGSVNEDVVSEEKLFWGDLLASVTERIVRSEVDIVGMDCLWKKMVMYCMCCASLLGRYCCVIVYEEGLGTSGELELIGGED